MHVKLITLVAAACVAVAGCGSSGGDQPASSPVAGGGSSASHGASRTPPPSPSVKPAPSGHHSNGPSLDASRCASIARDLARRGPAATDRLRLEDRGCAVGQPPKLAHSLTR